MELVAFHVALCVHRLCRDTFTFLFHLLGVAAVAKMNFMSLSNDQKQLDVVGPGKKKKKNEPAVGCWWWLVVVPTNYELCRQMPNAPSVHSLLKELQSGIMASSRFGRSDVKE
jgi:hypothetical protein